MRRSNEKKLYILLTCFPDGGAKIIRLLTGFQYTHASIGLEGDMNTFYSFVTRGFLVEKITKYLRPDREPYPCRLYELRVPEERFAAVRATIDGFVARKDFYRYSALGVILALLHIPLRRKRRYFCSHFVAEVLGRCRAARLTKRSALYFPADLAELPNEKMIFQGNLRSYLHRFVPQAVCA